MTETEERIKELLRATEREGIDGLIEWLDRGGFFTSPASTRFHGSWPGGLAEHSLTVYERMFCEVRSLGSVGVVLDHAFNPGQKPLPIEPANIVIACLLHDVCKVGAYIPTKEGAKTPYRWNKQQPKGHGSLSVEFISKHIKLTAIEELMIRFHMGVYALNEFYEEGSWEYNTNAEYPLRGDHSKDENMTKEESQKARYGKSLRNVWFHNPICKLMYFADEISTLAEKQGEKPCIQ